MNPPARPAWKGKRPAPRTARGWGKPITDQVVWTQQLDPRQRYRIEYIDSQGEITDRIIEVLRIGAIAENDYIGIMDRGQFKTMRADRIRAVEQLSQGHPPAIFPAPQYADTLPVFPSPCAMVRVPQSKSGKRTWTVDLNLYTCSCPEKRIRAGWGYAPGQLGFVCDHIAKAILDNLPADADWSPQLIKFLSNPRKVHIDNLH